MNRSEELRQAALAKVRAGEIEEALATYDHALVLAEDEEARELITINKADAMIAIERSGPEVQALASIVMRRRNPRHTFLAAYALLFKYRMAGDAKRAIFYGNIAIGVAEEAAQSFWRLGALNELGIIYEMDSQFENAIESFHQALTLLDEIDDRNDQTFSRIAIVQNLAYNKIISGDTQVGVTLMESILDDIENPTSRSDAHIDLCYGYLDLEDYEKARLHGERGLEISTEVRQVRNAHYLLGEAAYKMGDIDTAMVHFDELARFYPDFRNLKHLLFAIDLRSMINLRL